MLGYLQCFPVS